MKKRNQTKGSRRRTWPAILACVTVLTCGFFFAAQQHFSSMDFGIKNNHLRKQINDLESEKRRLMLAREVSLSPAELKKAALKAKAALVDTVTSEFASVMTKDKLATVQTASATLKSTASNPLITKTVATSPTMAKPITASLQKPSPKSATVDRKFVAQRSAAE
jgi:hypothetical protein